MRGLKQLGHGQRMRVDGGKSALLHGWDGHCAVLSLARQSG
jgi:hypothetical protein